MSRRRALAHDEGGFAMVLVMGTMALLALLLIALTTYVLRGIVNTDEHKRYNASGDAAQAGVEAVLGALAQNPAYAIGPDVPAAYQAGWPDTASEMSWAKSTLSTLAATSSNVVTTPAGKYVVVRPAHLRTIYALGWSLDNRTPARSRVVKAEYVFESIVPSKAILTNSTTKVGGNFQVQTVAGSTVSADVHVNGNLSVTASSSSVSGSVTATGTNGFASGTSGAPAVPVPAIDPRYVYQTYSPSMASSWWDLCPDGAAHSPSVSGVPCTGPTTATPAYWTWNTSNGWTEGGAGPAGVYYIYQANATLKSTGTVTQTIITESSGNRGTCPKPNDGNFSLTGGSVRAFLPGIIVYSGNSINIGNNSDLRGGAVAAQDSINLTTGSAPGVIGYVMAENFCPGETNNFQGSVINYDPQTVLPFPTRSLHVTSQQELPGLGTR